MRKEGMRQEGRQSSSQGVHHSLALGSGPTRAARSDLGTSGVHSLGAGGPARGWEGCRRVRNLKLACGWRVSPPHPRLTFLTGFALPHSSQAFSPLPSGADGDLSPVPPPGGALESHLSILCLPPHPTHLGTGWRSLSPLLCPPAEGASSCPTLWAGQELPGPPAGLPWLPGTAGTVTPGYFCYYKLGTASPSPLQGWGLHLFPISSA